MVILTFCLEYYIRENVLYTSGMLLQPLCSFCALWHIKHSQEAALGLLSLGAVFMRIVYGTNAILAK